jgi:three-Cys-motif partner protein
MQKFGDNYTPEKLDAVEDYLKMYTQALKYQDFELVYFDGFAGTGEVQISGDRNADGQFSLWLEALPETEFSELHDTKSIIEGSATRALGLERPFDKYIFTERSAWKAKKLEELVSRHPHITAEISVVDASQRLLEFCAKTDWRKTRAVVFLDPFGSQVEWSTIERIAETRAIDLWYLFPAFWSVYRQISQEGKMTPEQERSICRILGTDEWKADWLKFEPSGDLFEQSRVVGHKQVDVVQITRYMIGRMRDVFHGGVLDQWLPLGPKKQHHFSLLFAWANPSDKAKLAAKLAGHVMSRK